ncbi:MAG: hypothetical protein WCY25_10230 [Moheibacter sp.]
MENLPKYLFIFAFFLLPFAFHFTFYFLLSYICLFPVTLSLPNHVILSLSKDTFYICLFPVILSVTLSLSKGLSKDTLLSASFLLPHHPELSALGGLKDSWDFA